MVATYVALAADHLLAVELGGKSLQRGLNDTTTEAEDQVEGRLLFNGCSVSQHFIHATLLLPSLRLPAKYYISTIHASTFQMYCFFGCLRIRPRCAATVN